MDAKTIETMNALKAQAARLQAIVESAQTPEELVDALKEMCSAALRLETGAFQLTNIGGRADTDAAQKYLDAVTARITSKGAGNAAH